MLNPGKFQLAAEVLQLHTKRLSTENVSRTVAEIGIIHCFQTTWGHLIYV